MQQSIKILVKIVLAMGTLSMAGCDGGSSNGSTQSTAGNLAIDGTDYIGIHASEEYTISLVNSSSVTTPVQVKSNLPIAATINNSAASIIFDGCSNGLTTKNPSCTIFIKGTNVGKSNLEVIAPNYDKVSKPLTVAKQWGSIGGKLPTGNISHIIFNENTIYIAGDLDNVYASTNGSPWYLVGGGAAMGDSEIGVAMAVDDSRVCVLRDKIKEDDGHIVPAIVRCSFKNGAWQNLMNNLRPAFTPDEISLYNNDGNVYVYVAGITADGGGSQVFSCQVDNCKWEQRGIDFYDSRRYGGVPVLMSGSTTFISTARDEDKSIWYQDTDTMMWEPYGKVNSPATFYTVAIDDNSLKNKLLVVEPASRSGELVSSIYFGLDKSSMTMESYDLPKNPDIHTAMSEANIVAVSNEIIYALTDNNRIYSTHTTGVMPDWEVVSASSMPFDKDTVITAIAVHDNKLYAATNTKNLYAKVYVIDITQSKNSK